jgi:hypothetical protein
MEPVIEPVVAREPDTLPPPLPEQSASGRRLELVRIARSDVASHLDDGRCDLVVSGTVITPPGAAAVRYSRSLGDLTAAFVVPQEKREAFSEWDAGRWCTTCSAGSSRRRLAPGQPLRQGDRRAKALLLSHRLDLRSLAGLQPAKASQVLTLLLEGSPSRRREPRPATPPGGGVLRTCSVSLLQERSETAEGLPDGGEGTTDQCDLSLDGAAARSWQVASSLLRHASNIARSVSSAPSSTTAGLCGQRHLHRLQDAQLQTATGLVWITKIHQDSAR